MAYLYWASTQWAAVTIHSLSIRVPPQKWLLPIHMEIWRLKVIFFLCNFCCHYIMSYYHIISSSIIIISYVTIIIKFTIKIITIIIITILTIYNLPRVFVRICLISIEHSSQLVLGQIQGKIPVHRPGLT